MWIERGGLLPIAVRCAFLPGDPTSFSLPVPFKGATVSVMTWSLPIVCVPLGCCVSGSPPAACIFLPMTAVLALGDVGWGDGFTRNKFCLSGRKSTQRPRLAGPMLSDRWHFRPPTGRIGRPSGDTDDDHPGCASTANRSHPTQPVPITVEILRITPFPPSQISMAAAGNHNEADHRDIGSASPGRDPCHGLS